MEKDEIIEEVGITAHTNYFVIAKKNLRWMGSWKISFASEAKEHSLAKELVGSNLDAESVAFTFPGDGGGDEVRTAPMAFVPNLVAKVTQVLDQNDKYNILLTWHW